VLSAKIGAITGLTLAEMNRFYLPRWLNIVLWIIAEATIICTDVGQVRRHSDLGIKLIVLGHWDSDRDKSPEFQNPSSGRLCPVNFGLPHDPVCLQSCRQALFHPPI
jgi:hypothetical protein